MSSPESVVIERGSPEHRAALQDLEHAVRNSGLGSQAYNDAKIALEALQGRLDWRMPEGVVPSEGVGRRLSVQILDCMYSRVPRGSGEEITWSELKARLVSQSRKDKHDAPFFLLSRFYSDGCEKLSFTNAAKAGVTPSYGISRCHQNVEWIDGLTLDFDSGLTVEGFKEAYGQYEFLLTSSYNHEPSQGKHKFRVVIPFKERVGPLELKRRRGALIDMFEPIDLASFTVSQGFYAPSHPPGREPVRVENSGEWFDLMALKVDEERTPNLYGTSMTVQGDGDAAELVAAVMNCMPPDTEYFRKLKCFKGQTYPTVIVPFLFSLGYWGRENGLEIGELYDLVYQRWGDTQYAGSFSSLLSKASYGGIESCLGFIERVGAGVSDEVDLGFEDGEFKEARRQLDVLLAECVSDREAEVLPIDEATNRLQNLLLQRVHEYSQEYAMRSHLVIRFEAGAGKTKQAHFILGMALKAWKPIRNRQKPWVIDYLVPDNDLACEVTQRLQDEVGEGFHVQHIQGRRRLCIDPKVIEAEELGCEILSPCEGCDYVDKCPYPQQYEVPTDKHLVRVIYQGMACNKKAGFDTVEAPDFYIIDEDFVATLYAEKHYGHEYDFVKTLPADLNPNSTGAEIREGVLVKASVEEGSLRRTHDKATPLPSVQFAKFRKGEIGADVLEQQIARKNQEARQRPDRRSHAACRALVDDLKDKTQAVSIREGVDGARIVVASYLRPLAARYAESPCIYLDATVEPLVVREALLDSEGMGREVDFWECNVGYSDGVTVRQDTSRSWSMASLCPNKNGERQVNESLLTVAWDEIVRRSLNAGRRFAVISYKAIDQYISEGKAPPGCRPLKGDPLFCGVGHFGNIRGQDCFNQEGVEDLYVIGRMMVSTEVVKDRARGIFARDRQPLSLEKKKVFKQAGPGIVLPVDEYVDERVQAVDNMLNAAETAQAAHRLRLIHGDTVKNLYLVTNAWLPIRVNKVMGISGGGSLTKAGKLAAQVRSDLVAGEFAIRVGKQWKSYPKCLSAVDARMRRAVLDSAVTDLGVGLHFGFDCVLKKPDRKTRKVLILGEGERECRAKLSDQFSDDVIMTVESAA